MPEIIIDEEFRNLLPALDGETYAWLEDNIQQNGCWAPLVLWNGILIDGHHRYEICTKHDIPFKTIDMEFDSRDEVKIWIITTQIARRNMTPFQLSYFRGLHYMTDKRVIKNEGGRNQYSEDIEVRAQSEPKAQNQSTAERLAEQYNVSRDTIKRDAQIAKAIGAIGRESAEAKRKILSGRAGISRKQLREFLAGAENDIIDVAVSIEDGTFESRRRAPSKTYDSNYPVTGESMSVCCT